MCIYLSLCIDTHTVSSCCSSPAVHPQGGGRTAGLNPGATGGTPGGRGCAAAASCSPFHASELRAPQGRGGGYGGGGVGV